MRFGYKDRFGEEVSVIENTERKLSVTLRGINFEGPSFEYLGTEDPAAKDKFHLYSNGCLCHCEFLIAKPITVITHEDFIPAELILYFNLGKVKENDPDELEEMKFHLHLSYDEHSYKTKEFSFQEGHDIESALFCLKDMLPQGYSLKCCFFCMYSAYSSYGKSFFNDMQCYRNLKGIYGSAEKLYESRFWREHKHDKYVSELNVCSDYKVKPKFMENRRSGE